MNKKNLTGFYKARKKIQNNDVLKVSPELNERVRVKIRASALKETWSPKVLEFPVISTLI